MVRSMSTYSYGLQKIPEVPALTNQSTHNTARYIESAIKERLENVYDIMIHVEPQNNDIPEDGFGLSAGEL